MPKHFIKTEDFTREEYLEVCRRAKIFQDGIKEGKDFTSLCPGKVLASLFFQESTRTSTIMQSAMIKLGGGYVGISNSSGTYVGAGEEDVQDFIEAFEMASDIVAVRHKSLNLDDFVQKSPVPLVNGMCGGEEHTNSALALVYALYRRNIDFKKLKYGVYGMVKSSRPAKAFIKALSIMGATIYEDSVIDEFETPAHIREFCNKVGGKLIKKKLDDFISEVDVLEVLEGLPQPGEDPKLVEEFNRKVKIFSKKDLAPLRSDAYMLYVVPRVMTDGRLTVEKDVDEDPRVILKSFFQDWIYATMGLYTYLLDIPIK